MGTWLPFGSRWLSVQLGGTSQFGVLLRGAWWVRRGSQFSSTSGFMLNMLQKLS